MFYLQFLRFLKCGLFLSIFTCARLFAQTSLDYSVLLEQPHDTALFTQGLVVDEATIYESSGLFDKSLVRSYDVKTGQIIAEKRLAGQVFAEGLTLFNNKLYLLSWRNGLLFILDPSDLALKRTKKYRGEGWGITHDGTSLITSDGSSELAFRDPNSFAIERTITVSHAGRAVDNLNELEYARQAVWANRWQHTKIYRIDPRDGKVTGLLDLTPLVPGPLTGSREHVLNGIAYDAHQDAFWVTGKNWPTRYLIRIKEPSTSQANSE